MNKALIPLNDENAELLSAGVTLFKNCIPEMFEMIESLPSRKAQVLVWNGFMAGLAGAAAASLGTEQAVICLNQSIEIVQMSELPPANTTQH